MRWYQMVMALKAVRTDHRNPPLPCRRAPPCSSRACQSRAMFAGRGYVTVEDVKILAPDVLGHRVAHQRLRGQARALVASASSACRCAGLRTRAIDDERSASGSSARASSPPRSSSCSRGSRALAGDDLRRSSGQRTQPVVATLFSLIGRRSIARAAARGDLGEVGRARCARVARRRQARLRGLRRRARSTTCGSSPDAGSVWRGVTLDGRHRPRGEVGGARGPRRGGARPHVRRVHCRDAGCPRSPCARSTIASSGDAVRSIARCRRRSSTPARPVEERFVLARMPVPSGFRLHIEGAPARLGGDTRFAVDRAVSHRGGRGERAARQDSARCLPRSAPPKSGTKTFSASRASSLRRAPRPRSVRLTARARSCSKAAAISRSCGGSFSIVGRLPTEEHYRTRAYVAGDDTRRVHWKQSINTRLIIHARAGVGADDAESRAHRARHVRARARPARDGRRAGGWTCPTFSISLVDAWVSVATNSRAVSGLDRRCAITEDGVTTTVRRVDCRRGGRGVGLRFRRRGRMAKRASLR